MNRPSVLQVGGTLYWVIVTRNPDTMVLKDADSTPTVAVRKNGASTADSVTVTKRSATTGIYDCSYNPASEVEGDKFTFEESATVTGTTTSSATYRHNWDLTVIAVERGTDGANTTTPPTTGAIADAVLTESVLDHRNVNNSLAKFIWQIRNANLTIDGTVTNAITPTTLTFSSNVSATTSAYAHAVLLFISGPLAGENSPIISYNNTNGVFVLEEPLTAAPSDGDEFVVIAGSHVHAIADIQSGLATSAGVTAAFTEIKGAGWSSATDTLEEIRDAVDGISGGGGTGTGARTVTITVDDGTNPLENARVRVTNGAETYVTNTNVSGVATFNLDDATWVVSITKAGYTFAGASLVVNGTEAVTYSMSLVVITPSSVNKVTGYWTVLDETGSAAASVVVTIKARQPLRGGAGLIHDAGERTATSNGSGLVQFTNLIPGWRYAVVANDDYVADFVVPSDAVTSVELGSIVARLP